MWKNIFLWASLCQHSKSHTFNRESQPTASSYVFVHGMSLNLLICTFNMKMSLTLVTGAYLSTWKLTEYLKSRTKIFPVTIRQLGSGCGAVGRAVAYDTRGPRFESSHRQLLLNIYLLLTVCRKDENKEKRPGMAHLLKKTKKNYTAVVLRQN